MAYRRASTENNAESNSEAPLPTIKFPASSLTAFAAIPAIIDCFEEYPRTTLSRHRPNSIVKLRGGNARILQKCQVCEVSMLPIAAILSCQQGRFL